MYVVVLPNTVPDVQVYAVPVCTQWYSRRDAANASKSPDHCITHFTPARINHAQVYTRYTCAHLSLAMPTTPPCLRPLSFYGPNNDMPFLTAWQHNRKETDHC
jgi:hypothetical protein